MTTAALLSAHQDALERLLHQEYGLRGSLLALPGEADANLKLTTDGGSYLVKVCAPDTARDHIDLQIAALDHLAKHAATAPTPTVTATLQGNKTAQLELDGAGRTVWLSSWLDGRTVAEQPRITPALAEQIGRQLGSVTRALLTFSHPAAARGAFKWDLLHADWIGEHLDAIADDDLRAAVAAVHETFVKATAQRLRAVRRSVVHNDANDHNLLTPHDNPDQIAGIFDFGDLCETALVADLAIAACYVAMASDDPLAGIDRTVRGFHRELPLDDDELALIVPLIETRLAVSITNASVQHRLRPDDPYVMVSQRGARALLGRLHGRHPAVAEQRLRAACDRPASASIAAAASAVAALRGRCAAVLELPMLDLPGPDRPGQIQPAGADHSSNLVGNAPALDLSFETTTAGDDPTSFDEHEAARRIARELGCVAGAVAIGRYAEPRPIYTSPAFAEPGPASARRTVHLGIDVFAPARTPIAAPLDAVVVDAVVCPEHLDYGGLVVLEHAQPDGATFCTLYGHLSPESVRALEPGRALSPGETFATLGTSEENGGWPPHLHLQVLAHPASDLATTPALRVPRGVADPDDLPAHQLVYPDPSALLGIDAERASYAPEARDLQRERNEDFPRNLKTSYDRPLALVRGFRHTLFDRDGRRYLDAYNNVPHVGHCHPRVVRAVQQQTALLATNTRYLHDGMHRYAERLRQMLPNELSMVFFTPSGSEANELALRLARQHTGGDHVAVMDHGYHGHTNATMAMSPYKFRQPGALPKPDWVHVTAQPDVYRGPHRGGDAGHRYAADVAATLAAITGSGERRLAAYLCECLPSVGGQLELPDGFLSEVYRAVRSHGGLCIADDVQTGLWRTGTHAFGFEPHGVVPDVLVLGKPLGNGFPLGAVITTRAIADTFAQGPEFFSTFGGSTVGMAAGAAVLDVLRDEGLAENARSIGDQLLHGLRSLQQQHECIGDVRGRGFFLGLELVTCRDRRDPAADIASRIKNRLRDRRVLIGTDGPHDNVLKIRPPMTFDAAAADCLLDELDVAFRLEAVGFGG